MHKIKSFFTHPMALMASLLVVFIAAAVLIGLYAFQTAEKIFAGNSQPIPPTQIKLVEGQPTPGITQTVVQVTPTVEASGFIMPQPWDGAERVNILLLGLDYRDWEKKEGPPRSDSMIVMTIDPVSHTAGVLNIPRDLWVNIPGYGYYKINMAYYFGEGSQLPEGGPGLAVKTVEQFLGIPIHYYAQIDFEAFVKFINELDGITVEVTEEISIDPIGKYNTVVLEPGVHTLDGDLALAYARARKGSGDDFGRASRQQEVIVSIRRRLLKLGPRLIPKAPQIYADMAESIRTNLSLDQAIQLGLLALQIDLKEVKMGVISPPNQVVLAKSPDGSQDILKPISGQIRILRDEIFSTPPNSLLAQAAEPEDLVKAESARITVLNASGASGLATRTADYLRNLGANVIQTAETGEVLDYTSVTIYTGKPYTLKYLVDLMTIQPYQVFMVYNPASEVDVVVKLGGYWAGNNPLP